MTAVGSPGVEDELAVGSPAPERRRLLLRPAAAAAAAAVARPGPAGRRRQRQPGVLHRPHQRDGAEPRAGRPHAAAHRPRALRTGLPQGGGEGAAGGSRPHQRR